MEKELLIVIYANNMKQIPYVTQKPVCPGIMKQTVVRNSKALYKRMQISEINLIKMQNL